MSSLTDSGAVTASSQCPTCGKRSHDEPNFCSACGADLRGLAANSDTFVAAKLDKLVDDRYRILEKLGEGGMGTVFKVEHVRMGKIAALKLMRSDVAIDGGLKARFLQEARTVAKLSCSNTVQVFDAGQLDDGAIYMAMEFVPGKDAAWHLKANGPMSEASAINLAVQVLTSLQEAHEHGIVHRDIKPANVMVVKQRRGLDQVKLLDFGIAKLLEGENRAMQHAHGDFAGTPAYMAPEQIRGERIDARGDLYSLGAMLFELVTGRPPFEGNNSVAILNGHLSGDVPAISVVAPTVEVSEGFEAIVRRALKKQPDDRFQSADDMRAALVELNEALGVKAADVTPLPHARLEAEKMMSREDFDNFERRLRRQRTMAPIIALLALGGLGFAGWEYATTRPLDVAHAREVEPNDQVPQATRIQVGTDVTGTIGSAQAGGSDRDLYVATVRRGRYRFTLHGVTDLNLTVEILQGASKVQRKVFLDDVGEGGDERLDALLLEPGEVYLRIEEKAFATQPTRPSREKALVPYLLRLELMPEGEGIESEPNDTSSTAQLVPLQMPMLAFTGVKLDDPERLMALRADAPFTSHDAFRVEAASDELVVALVVPPQPPDHGSLLVVDGAALEAWQLKRAQATAARPAPKAPAPLLVKNVVAVVELKPIEAEPNLRRLRVLPGDDTPAGAPYRFAFASTGPNGLDGLLALAAQLGAENSVTAQRQVLEWGVKMFERRSPDVAKIKEALAQLP